MALRDFMAAQRDGLKAMSTTGVMGLHMVSGPAVGFAIGYGLDALFETTPWGGLTFLLIGIGAGFLNVWRDTQALLARLEKKDRH